MNEWRARLDIAMRAKGITRAAAGRSLPNPITGQAVTLKLQGKRDFTVDELIVLAGLVGQRVSTLLAEDEACLPDETARMVEVFTNLPPSQRARLLDLLVEMTAVNDRS